MRKAITLFLIVFLFLASLLEITIIAAQASQKIPVIVGFKDKSDAGLIGQQGGDIKYQYSTISAVACSLPQGAIGTIKNEHKYKTHLRQMILNNVHLDLKVGRFDQARQIAEKFLSQYGENAQMYYLLGEVYRQQRTSPQDLVRAKHYYEMAIRLDSEFPEPYRALGLIFYKKGEMQTAKKYFEASLALAPNASENSFIRDYLRRICSLKTWGRDGDE